MNLVANEFRVKNGLIVGGDIVPDGDSTRDLGTSSLYFAEAYIDKITTTGVIELGHASQTTLSGSGGTLSVEGTAVVLAGGANHDGFSDFVANEHIDHSGVSISSGSGLTGGGTIAATRTLTVGAGTGITVNTNDVAITAAQTGITSVLNTGLVIGRDSTDQIKFSTNDQIIFRVGNADGVTFKASGEIEATKFDGALEGNADTATAAATVAVTPNNGVGSFVNENNLIMFLPDGDSSTDAGYYSPESSTDFHYNPATTILTVPKIAGDVTGDVTGTLTGNASGSAGTVTSIGNLTGDVTSSNRATTIANNAVTLAKMAGLARGKIIYGDSNGDPAALALGTNGKVLTSDGTDISWQSPASGGDANQTITTGTGISGADSGDDGNFTASITAAQTGITSVLNTGLVIGRDSTDQIKFGTDNQIIFRVGNADGVTFKASGEIEATKFDGALEGNADTATLASTITIADESSDTTCFPLFATAASGSLAAKTGSNLTFNSSTGILTATGFTGTLTANDVKTALNADLSGDFTIGTQADDTATFTGSVVIGDGTVPIGQGQLTVVQTDDDETAHTLLLMDNEDDANRGPILTMYRNTASPAANDRLGSIRFNGEDGAGAARDYAKIEGKAVSVGSASHTGALIFSTTIGASITDIITMDGTTGGAYGGIVYTETGIKTLSNSVSATSTANNNYITLLEVPHATFKAVKASIHITDSSSNEVQTQETIAHYDGSNANYSNYGIIFDGAAAIGAIEVDINSSNIRIRFKNTQGATRDIAGSIHAVCHP